MRWLYSLLILCFCMPVLAQPPLTRLKSAILKLDQDPVMRSANWSMTVMDARTGKILVNHNGYKSLSTASTMKVVTTITAMDVLGPSFRFATELQYDGTLGSDKVLRGNLYIRGDGDPTLGSSRFGDIYETESLLHLLAEQIKSQGIERIEGAIIGDASIFSTQLTPPKWSWEDMGNYYGAGAAGLNLNENLYRLDLKPGTRVGTPTTVLRTVPHMPDLVFKNEITTGAAGSGDNGYIYGAPYTSIRYLRGTIPAGYNSFSIKGSIPDPASFAAYRLREELIACGITVSGSYGSLRSMGQNKRNGKRTTFFTHYSPTLTEIVEKTNMRSINLYAEALAKRVAVKLGKIGDTQEAMGAFKQYWEKKGMNLKGTYMRDGAGLSPNNALSTQVLVQLLKHARNAPYGKAFTASLPVAGQSGSLKGMFKGTVAVGKISAKSGYISGTRGYAGYATTVKGQPLIFAIISNNYACSAGAMRKKMEPLMRMMVEGN
ncbi:MAG: D-alanyl-D-alanine carboxypeptidase/D-alanyl-D-alanine-endopeptidase [Bacteroidota bacterium]